MAQTEYPNYFEIGRTLDLTEEFENGETITAIGGSAPYAFIGTSNGRVFQVDINVEQKTIQVMMNIQLSVKSPVIQLCQASAIDMLLVVCNNTVYEIITGPTFAVSYTRSNVSIIALNTNPDNDNPFALQYAFATTGKQIQICELKNLRTDILQKISTTSPVLALAYNKDAICYATKDNYIVYNITTKRSIILFPFDPSSVRPVITCIGEEFLLSGMDGLAIFVTKDGGSNRAPFRVRSQPMKNFMIAHSYILVLCKDEIEVVCSNDLKTKQIISLPFPRLIHNLDGAFLTANTTNIYELRVIPWQVQVEILLLRGHSEDALRHAREYVLNNPINGEEAEVMAAYGMRIGFKYFFEGTFERAKELFLEYELDPRELIALYPELEQKMDHKSLLHDHSSVDTVNICTREECLSFLGDYLRTLRNDSIAMAKYKKIICTAELKLNILSGIIADCSTDVYGIDFDLAKNFLVTHGYYNYVAKLACENGDEQRAFDIWKSIYDGELSDPTFKVSDIFRYARRISNKFLFLETLKWLLEADVESSKQLIVNCSHDLNGDEIVPMIETYPEVLIPFLEFEREQGEFKWDTKLAFQYLHDLSKKLAMVKPAEVVRSKLRTLILDSPTLNRNKLAAEMQGVDTLKIEHIFAQAKTNPDKALEQLLAAPKDLDAAEMLCSHFGKEKPQLGLKLLKGYFAETSTGDNIMVGRMGRLINDMADYIEPVELLNKIPERFQEVLRINDVSSFLMRTVSKKNQQKEINYMKAAAAEAALNMKRNIPLDIKPIVLDEDSKCQVCHRRLSLDSSLSKLSTGFVVHSHCIKNKNLCPITNQLL